MTFGYDSGLAFSRSKAGVENFSKDLLNRLRLVRSSHEAQDRPLVFIAHSLGGIVVKKALILAHDAQDFYGSILNSTTGIAFMGTPHRGSELIPWTMVLSNLINVASMGQGIRKDVLCNLKTDSDMLMDISRQFVHRTNRLKIMTFVEQQIERPLTSLVVPEYSAVLGLPNEMILPLNAHHRGMCRYPSIDNQNYKLVENAIKDIVYRKPARSGDTPEILASTPKKTGNIIPTIKSAGATSLAVRSGFQRSAFSGGSSNELSNLISSSKTSSSALNASSVPPRPNFHSGTPSLSFSSQRSCERIPSLSENSQLKVETLTIRISGLRNRLSPKTYLGPSFSQVLRIPSDTTIAGLGKHLLKEEPGLKYWKSFRFSENGPEIGEFWADVFTTPVEVTSGRSCYDQSRGNLKINRLQSIASFFSKVFPYPVEAKLRRTSEDDKSTPFARVSAGCISVGKGDDPDLLMSFMRTVRVPEDRKTYCLPPGLGSFPIFDIRPFSPDLPPSMVTQGGLFFPMYQMEAMWINFTSMKNKKFAIRPFLGGVNGILGEALTGNMASLLRQMNSLTQKQDYIVLPDQKWLDGIATSPGIIKQFVATSMAPPRRETTPNSKGNSRADGNDACVPESRIGEDAQIGATVEWQVTGQDTVGGIQLQIIPSFDVEGMYAGSVKDTAGYGTYSASYHYPKSSGACDFDVLKTPKELGLQVGDIIHIKDMKNRRENRKRLVGDLLAEAPITLTPEDVIELEEYHQKKPCELIFNVHRHKASEPVFSFKFEDDDNFDDIVSVIRDKLQGLSGVLHVSGIADNAPDYLLPVHNWVDFRYFCGILENRSVLDSSSKDIHMDFVWMPPNTKPSRNICCVKNMSNRSNHPVYGGGQPLLIALGLKSIILDLRKEMEKVTGTSTEQYPIETLNSLGGLANGARVFGQDTGCRNDRFLTFLIRNDRGAGMLLFVKDLKGRVVGVNCKPADSVNNVKRKIQDELNLHPDLQRLIFGGKQLEGYRSLSDYNIQKGSTLYLVTRLHGGGPEGLTVRYGSRQEHVSFFAPGNIGKIKAIMFSRLGILPIHQILMYNREVLHDNDDLHSYWGRSLDLADASDGYPTLLGIGAGGSITQHIERDENNPRIWDVANSKILNVQIIDSTTFRLLTGLNPPRTPINAQMYKQMGLPFYSLWRDEGREDGVAGAWGGLVGVAEVASKSRKSKQEHTTPASEGSGEWGLLNTGAWGLLGSEEENIKREGGNGAERGFKEQSFEFPIVLLDVDDTLPKFRSVAEPEESDEVWEDMEGEDDL